MKKIIVLSTIIIVVLSSGLCMANGLNQHHMIPMGDWVAECPRCHTDCHDYTETGDFTCDRCGYKFHTNKLK
ncbi:MAG: hypothetical protein H6Q68_2710 [Firmicutes bacterium]|nr:hypothetical protein [Bacillota bacterium]